MNGYRDYRRFRLSREERVLTVTITGASPLNFIDGPFHRELAEIFADIAVDQSTDAVVLTSSGRCFCAGADIAWLRGMNEADKDIAIAEGRKIIVDLLEVPQPIICAVNGPAIGLGATVALFCDIVIASEAAVFADPHVVVGLVAGDGGAIIWPWLIGINRAKEFLLTGDRVPAAEALSLGLINRVVPGEDLLASAHQQAHRLAAACSQKALRGTKASVNKILRDHVNLVLDTSLAIERQCMSTDDHEAAMATFMASKN
jgi:enoyl-CoA hydratase